MGLDGLKKIAGKSARGVAKGLGAGLRAGGRGLNKTAKAMGPGGIALAAAVVAGGVSYKVLHDREVPEATKPSTPIEGPAKAGKRFNKGNLIKQRIGEDGPVTQGEARTPGEVRIINAEKGTTEPKKRAEAPKTETRTPYEEEQRKSAEAVKKQLEKPAAGPVDPTIAAKEEERKRAEALAKEVAKEARELEAQAKKMGRLYTPDKVHKPPSRAKSPLELEKESDTAELERLRKEGRLYAPDIPETKATPAPPEAKKPPTEATPDTKPGVQELDIRGKSPEAIRLRREIFKYVYEKSPEIKQKSDHLVNTGKVGDTDTVPISADAIAHTLTLFPVLADARVRDMQVQLTKTKEREVLWVLTITTAQGSPIISSVEAPAVPVRR